MKSASRAAYNTVINYIQLVLNVVIGLLTVRIILRSLGDIDYGIYHLIAGVVTLITFISESLSQTSIRFISVSLGRSRQDEISRTFSSCFSLHFYMGITLCLLLEIAGVFLFNGFLNIPAERLLASKVVFHSMVFTLFLKVVVTPFNAIIISHEKFYYTAIVGIVESLLKLVIAIVVMYSIFDRLVVYGVLMAVVTIISFVLLFSYAKIKYQHYTPIRFLSLHSIRNVLGFAGWTLLDVLGAVANRQGYAIMLNKFFGPSTNTVFALASQVEGHLYSISASAINTLKPQILKSYGMGDKERTLRLSMTAGKMGFSLMALLAIPVMVMLPDILYIWLGNYPEETVFFSRMMLIACMVSQLTMGLVYANQAIGNIKWFSIVVSCVRMSALPISIILLLLGCSSSVAMIIYMICESLAAICRIFVMQTTVGLDIRQFMSSVILHICPPFVISYCLCVCMYHMLDGILFLILNVCVSAFVYVIMVYFIGLTKEEKNSIHQVITSVLSKIR